MFTQLRTGLRLYCVDSGTILCVRPIKNQLYLPHTPNYVRKQMFTQLRTGLRLYCVDSGEGSPEARSEPATATSCVKFQASVYNVLPPTTAGTGVTDRLCDYVIYV